eukprot:ANDGO_04162.mRNA.1 Pyrazinamidase/nicotinamidase
MKTALIITDVQNDFISGALPVPHGLEVIAPINALRTHGEFDLVVLTQDWHPATHKSFASNNPVPNFNADCECESHAAPFSVRASDGQVMWPDHCLQESTGAEFHPLLLVNRDTDIIVRKGMVESVDSYSGFFDNDRKCPTPLHAILQQNGIDTLVVCGLATDYCVRSTVRDAIDLGYRTFFVKDCSRGISENDINVNGAITVTSRDYIQPPQ